MYVKIIQSNYEKFFRDFLNYMLDIECIQGIYSSTSNCNEKIWIIDLNIFNLNQLEKEYNNNPIAAIIDNTEMEKFKTEIEAKTNTLEKSSFFDFIKKLSSDLQCRSTFFYVEGDIVNKHYYQKNEFFPERCTYDFIDKHDTFKKKKISIYQHTKFITEKPLNLEDYTEKRIKAIVEVTINNNAEIELKAHQIQEIGPASQITEYTALKEKYFNKMRDYNTQKNNLSKSISPSATRIALICPKTSSGAEDFKKTLHFSLNSTNNLIRETVNMYNIDEIINAIERINADKTADIICIIRGGGNSEEICKYNNSKLIEAVINSNLPVITGIGHSNERLLLPRIATFGALTPTDAANVLNLKLISNKKSSTKTFTKKINIKKSENQKQEMQPADHNLQSSNDSLSEKLITHLKKFSLFSKFFNH